MTTEVLDTATPVTGKDDIHATRLMDDTHVTRTGLANMVKVFTPGGSSVELPDEGKTVGAYLADAQITVTEYDVVYLNGRAVGLDSVVPVGHNATNVITTSSEICCG